MKTYKYWKREKTSIPGPGGMRQEVCGVGRSNVSEFDAAADARARLTPKPQRLKMKAIKYNWPLDYEAREAARGWITEYEERSANFAICRYIKTFGRQHMPDAIVKFHDAETRAGSGLPLA